MVLRTLISALLANFIIASTPMLALGSAESPRPDEALQTARQAYDAGEYDRAAQILVHASSQNPGDGELVLLLAKSYYEAQQLDAAISAAERVVATEPQNSVAHE